MKNESLKEKQYFEKINEGLFVKTVPCSKYKTKKYIAKRYYKNISNI